jgi:hypothetical protein
MKSLQHSYAVTAFIFFIVLFAYSGTSPGQEQPGNILSSDLNDCDYWTRLDTINHFLPAGTARRWINRYINNKNSICNDAIDGSNNVLFDSCISFNRKAIHKILTLENCIGLRVYLGMNDQKKVHVILGGVDSCGRTLYITLGSQDQPTAKDPGTLGMNEMGNNP